MIREDFAGAGGCSMGKRLAGITEETIGVEREAAPVATARAAGFKRIHATVQDVRDRPWGDLTGYTAGPPCQTFSMAGSGAGRKALDHLIRAAEYVADGDLPEAALAKVHDDELDGRSLLVLEPLLVIARHRPGWVLLEQVPAVQPIWDRLAALIAERWGYSVATGVLQAEQYGVPQTRKRAILAAKLDGTATLPTPTHSRYYPRTPDRLDEGLLKWVSMAEALGVDAEGFMRSNYGTGGDASKRGERSLDAPAPTITSKIDRNKWVSTHQARNSGPGAARKPRSINAPAYTIRAAGSGSHPSGVELVNPSRRVTVQEAAILQTFPADFPWQGTKSEQYLQVGNAVPPVLSAAIIRNLTQEVTS